MDSEKPEGRPPSKPPQRCSSHPDPPERTQQHRPAPAINLSPSAALLLSGVAGKRSSFGRFSNLRFSLIRTPNQSCEAPGVQLINRRDLQEVQLARTSSHRRTKETTRAIILASDPPPKCRSSLWKTLGVVKILGRLCRIFGRSRKKILRKG
ncbi:hypothetical protein Prudu_704S000100 [Prunus dulcis]|uniref:Uncharacterized protein n=1 Tax=Prunus dulcis TaxID=3755 RepID=A0A5H2XLT8_PRUDU|nr:hypothetical protein Prudu_704S000100 [Prunus dulcis]